MQKGKESTEYSWQNEAKEYFKYGKYAQVWFEYMEWLIILGSLEFLATKTTNRYLGIVNFISWFFLYNFIQQNLWTIKYQMILPKFIKGRAREWIAYITGALLVSASYIFVRNVVEELSQL